MVAPTIEVVVGPGIELLVVVAPGSEVLVVVVAPTIEVVVGPGIELLVVVAPGNALLVVVVAPTIEVVVAPGRVLLVVVVDTAQFDFVTTLVSRVTDPFWASSLPSTVVPVTAVNDVNAKIFPMKEVDVPRVAELPTCQKILHDWALLLRLTVLFEAVVRVLLIWKTNPASGWSDRRG